MKLREHHFVHKATIDWFFLNLETCIYAKVTVSACFINWFTETFYQTERNAAFIILFMRLSFMITRLYFKNDVKSQALFRVNEN